MRQQKTL